MNIPICLISVTGQKGRESGPKSREAKACVLLDLIYFILFYFLPVVYLKQTGRECKKISLPKAPQPHTQQTLFYTDLASYKCADNKLNIYI